MYVVKKHYARSACPQGRKERHPVPDLYQSVSLAVSMGGFCHSGTRKDQVSTSLSDYLVSISACTRGMALGIGGSHDYLNACFGPVARYFGGVDFGAAGLNIVKVTPSEHVYAFDPCRSSEVTEFLAVVSVWVQCRRYR